MIWGEEGIRVLKQTKESDDKLILCDNNNFRSMHAGIQDAGWDFNGEPGILVPTKSWVLTRNLC